MRGPGLAPHKKSTLSPHQMAHAEVRRQCGADPAGGKIHASSKRAGQQGRRSSRFLPFLSLAALFTSAKSAHQMARPGAIAHSRTHLCPRASSLSFSSLVSPLRPLGLGYWVVATLGILGRCDPRYFIYFYVVTDAGPASHRVHLWQGGLASILTSSSGSS